MKIVQFFGLILLFIATSCGQWLNKEVAISYAMEAEEILKQGGDTLAALRLYDKAIALDSLEPMWYYNRGITKEDSGDSICGFEDYKRAIRVDSTFAAAYYAIGLSFYHKEIYSEAINYFEKIVSLNPNTSICYDLGITYYQIKEFEKAIFNFEKYKALGFDKDQSWTNYHLGMCYKGLGEMETAKYYLNRAAEQGDLEAKEELEKW